MAWPSAFVAGNTLTAAQMNGIQAAGLAWTAYTPSWAAGVNPAIGNGTLAGRFLRMGQTVHFIIEITMGSTTTYGTGGWQVSLPITPHGERLSFIGHGFDQSAANVCEVSGFTAGDATLVLRTSPTTAGGFLLPVQATGPFTWATADHLTISGTYETA